MKQVAKSLTASGSAILTVLMAMGCTPTDSGKQSQVAGSASTESASTESARVVAAAKAASLGYVRLVIAGDSIGAGNIVGAAPWADLNLPNGYEVKNHSVSGSYLGQHAAKFGYQPAELADYTSQYGAGNSWLIIQAGTNDLAQGAPSAELYNDNTVRMIQDAHAVGFRVLAATILPRNNRSFAWGAAQEQQRLAYNQLVRNNAGGADAIADLASDGSIGLLTAPNDPSLFVDGLHPTAFAYKNFIEPVYARALTNSSAVVITNPAPAPAPEPTPAPVPSNNAGNSGLMVYASSPSAITANVDQKSVAVNIHFNAKPMNSPFYAPCLSLVDSNLRYVDNSGACFNPPVRSDIANGEENFSASLSLPSGIRAGSYTVVMSYMQWTGGGWQRAPMAMSSGVTGTPEAGAAGSNQYAVATLTIGTAAAQAPIPAPTPAPAPSPAPAQSGSGMIAYTAVPQNLAAFATSRQVSVTIRYNAKPLSSPFYSPCLSLVDSAGRYVDSSGACFSPAQRSDVATGMQSVTVDFKLPSNLSPGTYSIALSYMQWTGGGWQRAAMSLGAGVVRSPEAGLSDPNQYAVGTLQVNR